MIIRDEADNERLLVQYLLGNLPEQERVRVEEMFFNNDKYYEQLLALESELFYDHAQGKLLPGDREQFEKRFLTSEPNRRRAMLASALAQKMTEVAPAEETLSGLAKRKSQSLKSFFGIQTAGLRLSLVALAVALLVSTWLAIEIVKLRTELNHFQAERMDREKQLQQQAQQDRAHAEELDHKLKLELEANALLKQELNKAQALSSREARGISAAISFVLTPSFVRDGGNIPKRIYVSQGTRLLRLQLNLKEEAEYKLYQAILLTAESVEKWSQNLLQVRQTGSRQTVFLELPAAFLEEGDYELRLKGLAADGTLEDTKDYYYFSIVRK